MKIPRKFYDILVEKDRFSRHDISNHETDPVKTGTLPNEVEWDLGTASLKRDETISLIGATSHSSERLLLTLKWRPGSPAESLTPLVTCISELLFTTKTGQTFRYEQIESYTPQAEANVAHGPCNERKFIQQYGSSGSKLKLIVLNPYRRTRLLFNGHMQLVGSDKPETRFVRLGCVLTPCGQIFDFLAKSTKFNWTGTKRGAGRLDQLALHDRHEQRVRFDGEISIFSSGGLAPERANFTLRGFHNRHLLELEAKRDTNYKTTRLYVALQNGKAFQLGVSWHQEQPNGVTSSTEAQAQPSRLHFGYTQFKSYFSTRTIVDFATIDFEWIRDKQTLLKEFLTVHSQQDEECLGCRLSEVAGQHSANWLLAEGSPAMSEQERRDKSGKSKVKGWALWTEDDGIVDSPHTIELIQRNRRERMEAIASGKLAGGKQLDVELAKELLVVSIDDHLCASSDLVGSKAASLAQLVQLRNKLPSLSYQVPHAFVLTRFSWDLLERDNESLIRPLLDELVNSMIKGQSEPVRAKCEQLQRLIREEISLPREIEEQLLDKLKCRDVKPGVKFAVRSSSWGEDEGDMSAAGQLTTILNVEFEAGDKALGQISKAVSACFASKFSYENIQYKRQHGLPLDLPMAVVVQEMVSCEKAGVMFTCDPVTGDESCITITANFGLGESVVSAQADPDSIKVAVDLEMADDSENGVTVREVHIGKKELIIDSKERQASSQDRSKCCLSDDEILQLARAGRQLKKYYSSQQLHCDIEFGYLAGQLNLFQCRPVTGLEQWTEAESLHEFDRASRSELFFYSRANVGEVLPYAMRPLTQTFLILANWNVVMAQVFLDFQPFTHALLADDLYVPQCAQLDMICEMYHAFFNLFSSSFLQLAAAGKKDAFALALEIGMFGRELEQQPDLIEATRGFKPMPNPFSGIRYELKSFRMRWNPIGHIDGVKARIERKYKELKAELDQLERDAKYEWDEEKKVSKLLKIYQKLDDINRESYPTWSIHMVATTRSSEFNMAVMKLLSKYIDDPVQLSVASNKLLALSKDVISGQIPALIGEIAELIKEQQAPEVSAEAFLAKSDEEALECLMKEPKFIEFLDKFGHRCYHEFDFGSPRWYEEPQRLLEMIRVNLRSAGDKEASQERKSAGQKQAALNSLDQVLESHGLLGKLSIQDYQLLKQRLVPLSQLYLSARERSKNCLIQFTACWRLFFRQLGRELHTQLRLPDEQLIMFVPFDELEPLCRGPRPAVVAQALRRRQLFKRTFPPDNSSEAWKFDEIIREVVPNHLKPSRELDEQLMRAPRLAGTPASSGKVRGRVCLVKGYQELSRVKPGSILLTHSTDIAFSPVFPLVSGIITEVGGLISHGAVVAREYGLPCVIGIPEVTRILQDDEEILLDADTGTIIRLAATEAAANDAQSNGNTRDTTAVLG